MKRTLLVLLLSTSALAQPFGPPPGGPPPHERGDARVIPPPNWWRNDEIRDALKLDASQIKRLDAAQKEHADALTKLERDLTAATKDLKTALEAQPPVAEKIIAAGDRVGTLRSTLFHEQIVILAEQRAILTRKQWTALQEQPLRGPRPPR